MAVEYMSFSAHADAKGIMQLIRYCEPRNVMLVHGEAAKMEFLCNKIQTEFDGLINLNWIVFRYVYHKSEMFSYWYIAWYHGIVRGFTYL